MLLQENICRIIEPYSTVETAHIASVRGERATAPPPAKAAEPLPAPPLASAPGLRPWPTPLASAPGLLLHATDAPASSRALRVAPSPPRR